MTHAIIKEINCTYKVKGISAMIFKTSRAMINRDLWRQKSAYLLTESGFDALEIFGVGRLGKSRILEAANQGCRARELLLAEINFLNPLR